MTARVLYNYILVRIGLRRILPAEIVNRKAVRREITECSFVQSLNDNILYADTIESRFARKEVIRRLEEAADSVHLKYGLKFLVYELYRSPEKQAKLRERDRNEIVQRHPDLSEDQIQSALNRISAGVGGSGHQVGAAVDLTLCDENGSLLDMGTRYLEHNEKTATHSKRISKEQRQNRRILLDAMKEAGFANYPGEWWHFCYGDKMWAAYKHKRYALYGDGQNKLPSVDGSEGMMES